jgi:formylglycine-generating enzyme required for sulfatase activity
MDWSGEPELVYEFKSRCYPVKWISDDELEAACPYEYTGNTPQSDEIIPARVVRAGPREWRLQQDGLPTRNMPNPPQTAPYDETVTAAEIAPDPEQEAALSEIGYQQLDRPAAPTRPVAEPATTPSASSRKKGDVFSDCTGCPSMVVVPAGSFTMGSPSTETDRLEDEGPQRTVTIGSDFAVGRYEVRWAEWDACVADDGCSSAGPDLAGGDNGWGKSNRPVIEVDWSDAQAYVSWLSRKSGQRYRLLSEAEWEYAARAGNQSRWSFGEDETRLGSFGWSSSNSNSQTQPVGRKAANAFGLHDMHGNVWEWTQDCWNESYTGAPKNGSAWTSGDCSRRVVRGGSWRYNPQDLRSAARHWDDTPSGPGRRSQAAGRNYDLGFRVARTL